MMQIFSHTPTWVFFLFAGLLAFGLRQTRDRTVTKLVAYLLPAAMVMLSLSSVHSGFGLNAIPLAAWLAGLLVVTIVARRNFRRSDLSFDQENKRFFIPGSWIPLAVIMGIFFTKYALAVMQGLTSASVEAGTAAGVSLLLGGFSGYFCARAVALIAVAQRPKESFKPKPQQVH